VNYAQSHGVDASDMYARRGAVPGVTLPVVPGHEIAGEVAAPLPCAGITTDSEDTMLVTWPVPRRHR